MAAGRSPPLDRSSTCQDGTCIRQSPDPPKHDAGPFLPRPNCDPTTPTTTRVESTSSRSAFRIHHDEDADEGRISVLACLPRRRLAAGCVRAAPIRPPRIAWQPARRRSSPATITSFAPTCPGTHLRLRELSGGHPQGMRSPGRRGRCRDPHHHLPGQGRLGRRPERLKVTMDGEVSPSGWKGALLSIDPGDHTSTFETAGQPAVTRKPSSEAQKEPARSPHLGSWGHDDAPHNRRGRTTDGDSGRQPMNRVTAWESRRFSASLPRAWGWSDSALAPCSGFSPPRRQASRSRTARVRRTARTMRRRRRTTPRG